MTEHRSKLHPSLHDTFKLLKCVFGDEIEDESIPFGIFILRTKLTLDMITDVLAPLTSQPYFNLHRQVEAFDESILDLSDNLVKLLDNCGYEQWIRASIDTKSFVPSYLMGVHDAIFHVFPNGLKEKDYWLLIATLCRDMSFRGVARLLSALFHKDYHEVLNDAYGWEETTILQSKINEIHNKLLDCEEYGESL